MSTNIDNFQPLATSDAAAKPATASLMSPQEDNPSGGTFISSLDLDMGGADGILRGGMSNALHTKFLLVCCDFRKAVIVMNIISIILRLMLMLAIPIYVSFITNNADEIEAAMEDDAAAKELDEEIKIGFLSIMEVVGEFVELAAIFFGAVGLYGAFKFKQWGIITALCFYSVAFVLAVFIVDLNSCVFYALCMYSHIQMLRLMKAGIMTEENYHTVSSCCGNRQM